MADMKRIPWYYMWTPKYEIFHRLIQESMDRFPRLRADFCDRPMYYEQALFSKKLSTDPGAHAFQGSNLKVDLMIQCIEQNMGEYFIFSDADIYIASDKVKEICKPFMADGYDTVFMKEEGDKDNSEVNIGFILTKANEATLALWKDIQNRINLSGGHDQAIMSELLKTWSGKWGMFSCDHVVSNKTYSETFIIFQFLSSTNGYVSAMGEKLYTLRKYCYNIDHLLYLVDNEVINFINIYVKNKL